MFNNILYSWRSIASMPRQSILKAVSLAFGIGIAILLLARYAYLQSFDTSYADHRNLYQTWITWHLSDRDLDASRIIPGKIPTGIAEQLTDIFSSGSATSRGSRSFIETDNQTQADALTFYGDTLFFETLGIELLKGNPQDLNNYANVFLSDKMAAQLFGTPEEAVGRTLTANMDYDDKYTVAGIFRALPENNSICPDVLFSITPYSQYFRWVGGDSWWGFLRKRSDCTMSLDEINARIAQVIEKNVPPVNGITIEVEVRPISDSISGDSETRSMMYILLSLAVTILIIAIFNYVLISIASLARRAKSVGVHKCCGAGTASILSMFVIETVMILLAALSLAALLLFTFHEFLEDTLQTSMSELFNPSRLWVVASVIALTIAIGAFIPGIMLSRIEVSTIFRRFTESRRYWKRVLLFVQITGATIILTISAVVLSQLNFAINIDPGYRMEGLVIVPYDRESRDAFEADIRSLPYVIDYGYSNSTPVYGYSGSIIPDDKGNTSFSTNFEHAPAEYIDFIGFDFIAGRPYRDSCEIIINRSYCTASGWTPESAVGRVIGHPDDPYTITGVIEDFSIGTLSYDKAPFAMKIPRGPGIGPDFSYYTFQVHVAEPYLENTSKLTEYIEEHYPKRRDTPSLATEDLRQMYGNVTRFRNLTFIAAIAIFFITMMGLVGYLADEIQRRRREIAIRKANGAGTLDIIHLLSTDIAAYALPAVIIGGIIANWLSRMWLEQFTKTYPGLPYIYTFIPIIVFIVTVAAIAAMSWRTANSDPAEALKSE